MLDRTYLASVARQGPEPLFATISGAHQYGFASPDSDVDLRGVFMHPAAALLGLKPAAETVSIMDKSRIDLDWVAHDVRKFGGMLVNNDGTAMEQLYSPLVVITSPAHEELKALGRACIARAALRHYQGFAQSRRRRLAEPQATVKHLLYGYRVYLTGIHLMRTGKVVAHLETLNAAFGLSQVDDLVAQKEEGAEHMLLDEAGREAHVAALDKLETTLLAEHQRSALPETAPQSARKALDDWLVRVRLSMPQGES